MTVTAFSHQAETAQFWAEEKTTIDASDPGTGKTISAIEGYRRSRKGRMLVIAPLSIMKPSWAMDIDKYLGEGHWAIAHGDPKKRQKAFDSGADIVISNHDGVNWIADNIHVLADFSHLAVDEFTAFKNRATKRSKNIKKICNSMEYITLLSGTPNSNKITDIWYPALLLDGGTRLGTNFYRFQEQVCHPIRVGNHPNAVEYREKEGARDVVADLLRDITIRHVLEECVDMPEHAMHTLYVEMPPKVMKAYYELKNRCYLELQEGAITAIHAGSLTKKLLQLLTGAIYDSEGEVIGCHSARYELVLDLVMAREQCVVAFNWRHERIELCKWADKHNIPYAYIDGSVPVTERNRIVEDFQNGKLKVIFAHPQSAGHGLTLTAGTSTIWSSPTYNAEHFKQFNRRIYRNGQKRKTETIMIAAEDTAECEVYDKLNGKVSRMDDLLTLFARFSAS